MDEIELKYEINNLPDNLIIDEIEKIEQDYLYNDIYSAIRKRKITEIMNKRIYNK